MEGLLVHFILLVACIGLGAMFTGSEIALVSLAPTQVRRIIDREGRRGKRLLVWEREHDKILITIAIGTNIVNMAAAAVAVTIFARALPNLTLDSAAALSTVIMTVVVLIVGEITPKLLAKRHAVTIALCVMPFLIVLAKVVSPLSSALWFIARMLLRILGKEEREAHSIALSREEIRAHFDLVKKEGVLTEKENKMLNAILKLSEIKVRDIMVSRMEMACLDIGTDYHNVLDFVQKTGFSRIPVYKGSVENIKGILMAKDILSYWDQKTFRLSTMIRPAYFVPDMIPIDNLLRDFISKRIHLAIVVNEYGGVEGLVSLEDVIEEITGDIQDEYDMPGLLLQQARQKARNFPSLGVEKGT